MDISDSIDILNKERILGRTSRGRPLSDYAIQTVVSTIDDEKNHHMNVVECLGCGLIVSSLLVTDGCPNCGAIDLTENVINITDSKEIL